MSCYDFDMLLGLAADQLSGDEQRRVAAHLDACAACLARHKKHLALDSLLMASTARVPVRGAEPTAAMLRARRTRLLVRLAWWGNGLYRARRVFTATATGIALLLLGAWVVGSVRPRAMSNSMSLSPIEQSSRLKESMSARVWLLRASPRPDTLLQGQVPFEVHIGYQLYAAQSGLLSVRIVDVPSGQTRYFSPPQQVAADHDRAVVSFVLDSERARALFGSGPVQLEAVLRSAEPGITHTVLAHETFGATRYVLR